ASITAADVNNGSSDACGIASLTLDKTSFDCSNVGANTVTLTVVDVNGNSSSANAVVTVEDKVAAVVVTQDLTIQLDANGQASITAADVNNGSSDACGIASLTLDKTSFDCSNVGANTVTLTVVDVNGNSSSANAVVTVEDNIAPTIVCGGDVNVTAERNDCTPVVTWSTPVSADNCAFTVTSSHNSGDRFSVGTTTVSYTVTDASGNTASCSFNVTVQPNPLVATTTLKSYVGGNNVSCFGKKDGEASVSVEGGCLPYTYSWSTAPVQTAATATGLGAGTYTVTITDANNTTITETVTLTQPQVLTADAGANATVYYGYAPKACATLVSTVNGGSTAYSYSWSNGATSANNTVCPSVTTTYTLNVTDANGCKASDVAVICAVDVRCEQGGNAIKIGQGSKVLICHTSGNNKVQTLCVAADAVPAHLAHGDKLGSCGAVTTCFQASKAEESDVAPQVVSTSNLTAYPNPFANTTTLVFTATGSQRTVIEIMDMKGALMTVAFDGNTVEGQVYKIDVDGSSWANAIYIARVTTKFKT
ncbi:MAG: HYR domain-containing protein, partial [Bacteroidetes bacterium]|nr:HYR domain-containing protein [Bacteroidota bacterium]